VRGARRRGPPQRRARALRIAFFAGGPKFVLVEYVPLVRELLARGHEVHLGFTKVKGREVERLQELLGHPPGLSVEVAPRRGDGWPPVANLVRSLADLARYAHPRYDAAPVLRTRMGAAGTKAARRSQLEPLGRALAGRMARRLAATSDADASQRAIALLARLEAAIPTSRAIDRHLRELRPDVVLVNGVIRKGSQVDFVKSARRLRIPVGVTIASWDNLTNKGLIKVVPDRVFVWNEIQRTEATEQHGIPAGNVVATGAQHFDEWFARKPSTSYEEFARKVGLDPARGYVLYLGSSAFITENAGEVEFVERWIEALRASDDERVSGLGVLVRPHPGAPRRWRGHDLGRFGNVAVWPEVGVATVLAGSRDDFFDSLWHSSAVVGINTTAMIEAGIVGKSVLTILAPEFAQETTLHFHYLLADNGGFVHVAASLPEHVAQLADVLGGARDDERRRAFVQSFVRPHGLDRPATGVYADAVEELASLKPGPPPRGSRVLRALLGLEARLSRPKSRRGGEASPR
jgi:hypothetical protein